MRFESALLGEVADLALGKMLDQAKNRGEFFPYLANINVRWGQFDLSNLREMRFEEREKERYSLNFGDIVMCEGGEPGRCALWTGPSGSMMIQKALHRIRPTSKLNSRFLYYLLLQLGRSEQFSRFFTGSTIKHLPREKLAKVPIQFPDLGVQESIASILSSYDDLISINQRRIALLEEAARRLYREWFVHLRFPGHESTRVIDGLPEGWGKLPLTKIANFINGFAFKPSHHKNEGLPIIKIPELRYGVTQKTPRTNDRDISEKFLVRTGDIIFSWSGTLIVKEWTGEEALLNQHLFNVIPKNKNTKRFIFFSIEHSIPSLINQSVGSTMQHIRRSSLDNHLITIPPTEILNKFSEMADPLMNLALSLMSMNSRLTKARDLLLPRLMSGKLDVSNIPLPEEVLA